MKSKLTFLLALTFLFLFSGSVYGQEEVKKEYWDNGKLKSETHYKDGKKEGLKTYWDKNGIKTGETPYKNGKLEGLETGSTVIGKYEIPWKNGKREGLATYWYESGIKKEESYFKMERGKGCIPTGMNLVERTKDIIRTEN